MTTMMKMPKPGTKPRSITMVRALAILACASTAIIWSSAAHGQDVTELADFRRVVREAKSKVFPSVVYIRTLQETHESGEQIAQEISGSGVIVTPRGQIVTNWHVIDKARSVRCLLSDGRHFDADVIGSDKSTDLAIIQLRLAEDISDVPFARFGDSSVLREGDFVMAMGAPYGLNRSVSIGIVSCIRRYLDDTSEYSLWLQTDAAINPGNSGGPLVNTDGEIIGLNTRGSTGAEGMGFAVPSETILVLLDQLRDYGKVNWAWFGVQLQPLRDFNRDQYFEGSSGVIVAETDPESPARRAGLKPRDRILKVNGEPLTAITQEDLPSVRRHLALLPMNEPAHFTVERRDETIEVEITPREKGSVEGQELDLPRWDFTVKEINQFDNPDLFFHRTEGVFIYGLKWPGNARNSGLSENDIILKIGAEEVKTLDDVKAIHTTALEEIDRSHRLQFTVLRNGLMRLIVLDYARDHSKK